MLCSEIVEQIKVSVILQSSLTLFFLTQDIVSIFVRNGGMDVGQSHNQWLSTISESPNAISMFFVPITSLLSGVRGNGFLGHAVNLYLRCAYTSPVLKNS